MRLALVRQDFISDGAVERVTERALEALLERNVAVSLYTRSWPQTRLQLVEPVICNPFHLGSLWRDWGFARATCRDIRRSQPNLVESHERMLCCDIYRAGEGVQAVWLEEQFKQATTGERISSRMSPRNRYLLAIEKRLYASPWLRAVICNSKMVRDEVASRFGVAESKLHVVYNPVDSDFFHPGLRAERTKVIERYRIDAAATVYLLIASDFMRCNVGTAIDAFATLPPPAHMVVVGDAPDLVRYKKQARALTIADRVTFTGEVGDSRPYYGAADVFVLPTLYDPSPRTVLQALACGLPVVTSTKCGAAELLHEYGAGLVAASGDTASLAAHMTTLQDPGRRARFAANSRDATLPLSSQAITLQLVLLYRDLLASTTKPQIS